MKEEVKVSILLPVYNVEQYIGKSLESLLAQEFDSFEVILVNDGSTDDSLTICKEYAEKDKRIKVLNQENQGSGAARNAGLAVAKGEYVFFMDSDDTIEPNLLKDNYHIANRDKAEIVFFGHRKIYASSKPAIKVDMIPPNFQRADLSESILPLINLLNKGCGFALWEQMIKRETIQNNHLTFPHFKRGQDIAFLLDLYKVCTIISTNPGIYYNYNSFYGTNKFNADSLSNHKSLFKRLNLIIKYRLDLVESYELYSRFFILWFIHVVPINFVASTTISLSQKRKGILELLNDEQVNIWLANIPMNKVNSRFERISLIIFKTKNVTVLYYYTKIKLILKKYVKINYKKIIYG